MHGSSQASVDGKAHAHHSHHYVTAAHIAAKNGYNHDLQMTIITQWTKFMENAFGGVLKYLENDAHTPWRGSEVHPSTHRIIRNFLSESTYVKMSIHKGEKTEIDSGRVLTPSPQFIMRGINLPHLFSFEPSDHPKNTSCDRQMSFVISVYYYEMLKSVNSVVGCQYRELSSLFCFLKFILNTYWTFVHSRISFDTL